MAEVVEGVLRAWLEAQRSVLNKRFQQAKRRNARLQPELVLSLTAEILPPLAASDDAKSSALLLSVYDLILLQAGRGLLHRKGEAFGAHDILLRETFPAARKLLAERAASLPGALSNAVENLRERGTEFARGMTEIAPLLSSPQELLECGSVLAWRCGEARLRVKALELARKLPAQAVLSAFGVGDWPQNAAPVLIEALSRDAWRTPQQHVSAETLKALGKGKRPGKSAPAKSANLVRAARVGNFSGFGGSFDYTPLLLADGGKATRHQFWARCGDKSYRIDADIFGCVCRPDANANFPTQAAGKTDSSVARLFRALTGSGSDKQKLIDDGILRIGDREIKHPSLVRSTSYAVCGDCIACTPENSFRIHILVPECAPL